MNKKLMFLVAVIIIIVVGIAISLTIQPGSDDNQSVVPDPEGSKNIAEDQFKDVQLIFYNAEGSIAWNLEANVINNYQEQQRLELSPIKIDAINSKENTLLYELIANKSVYNKNNGQININGPIDIVKGDISFSTNTLDWQDGEDLLIATGGVSIESPSFIIQGEKFKADLALDNIIIEGKGQNQAYFTWEKGSDSN